VADLSEGLATIRTKSANEREPIFLITLPRCSLAVISLTPSSRNLLVHQTHCDQAKYLLLTGSQCFETSTRLQNRSFLDTTVTVALESELNRIEKVLFAKWFGQAISVVPWAR
jgi:hypothetical protein